VTVRGGRFWLTPPELVLEVRRLLGSGDWFDPCPFPRPEGWDALSMHWQKPWYLNPPFLKADGGGPMPFIRKAVKEGGPGVVVFSVPMGLHKLLEAGAALYPAGRIRWLEVETGARMPNPSYCALAVVKCPGNS